MGHTHTHGVHKHPVTGAANLLGAGAQSSSRRAGVGATMAMAAQPFPGGLQL